MVREGKGRERVSPGIEVSTSEYCNKAPVLSSSLDLKKHLLSNQVLGPIRRHQFTMGKIVFLSHARI